MLTGSEEALIAMALGKQKMQEHFGDVNLTACWPGVRRAFLGFVSRARMNRNKLDGAKELKKMVFFSNIVVAPLLEDLKARPRSF